jgi:hypothetical protein
MADRAVYNPVLHSELYSVKLLVLHASLICVQMCDMSGNSSLLLLQGGCICSFAAVPAARQE